MARWTVAWVAVAIAGCQRDTTPTPAPTPVAIDAGPSMQEPAVDAAALLRAFAERTKARITAEFPPPPAPTPDAYGQPPLAAIGECTRPTDAERAALGKAIDRALPVRDAVFRFGCTQPSGTIVDVQADTDRKDQMEWLVVRVHGARVRVLANYTGTATTYWSEWAHEVTVGSLVLADLDGDGIADDVIVKRQQEGGSQASYLTVSVWLSSTANTTTLNAEPLRDDVVVGRQHYVAGAPLALVVREHTHDEPTDYLCVIAGSPPKLAPCQQGADARAVDRGETIAGWFEDAAHTYGPEETALPDRDLLATMLAEMNAPTADRAPLLAAVPPTGIELRIAAEIAAAVATDKVVFGEHVALPQPPDTRAQDLMQVLGDTPCPPASGDGKAAVLARAAAWIANSDAGALKDASLHAEDDMLASALRTGIGRPSAPKVTSSCAAGSRGYYAVKWTYTPKDSAVIRNALFYLDAHGAVSLELETVSVGLANPCNACGPGPADLLDARFHRHGAALVALALVRGQPTVARTLVSADGVAAPMLAGSDDATAKWYRFAEPDDSSNVRDANDVVVISDGSGEQPWLWNGAWAPAAGSAATWMTATDTKTRALAELRALSPATWASSADVRVAILADLDTIHADPALIARVKAAGDSLPK